MLKLTNLIVILSLCCVVAIAAPYQELAPKAGYVPVYIREGNTPLSEIHPKLVEAFHEDEQPNQLQLESVKPEEVPLSSKDKEEEETVSQQEEEINNNNEANSNESTEDESVKVEDESVKVEETTASDIAEFDKDDLKIFADDEEEH